MTKIAENLALIQAKMTAYAQRYANKNPIQLLAVSKGQTLSAIQAAINAGQRCFAENYLQEAESKIDALNNPDLEWHFIGVVQSNKTRIIAEKFHWLHTLASEKNARRLNAQRPENLPPLNVCIEVNISQQATKAGVSLQQLPELAALISELPHLKFRGLMTIPEPTHHLDQQRKPFAQLRQAYEQLQQQGYHLDTLSMGMSHDFEAAIAEGTTLVRIGTAIFGARK